MDDSRDGIYEAGRARQDKNQTLDSFFTHLHAAHAKFGVFVEFLLFLMCSIGWREVRIISDVLNLIGSHVWYQ